VTRVMSSGVCNFKTLYAYVWLNSMCTMPS